MLWRGIAILVYLMKIYKKTHFKYIWITVPQENAIYTPGNLYGLAKAIYKAGNTILKIMLYLQNMLQLNK